MDSLNISVHGHGCRRDISADFELWRSFYDESNPDRGAHCWLQQLDIGGKKHETFPRHLTQNMLVLFLSKNRGEELEMWVSSVSQDFIRSVNSERKPTPVFLSEVKPELFRHSWSSRQQGRIEGPGSIQYCMTSHIQTFTGSSLNCPRRWQEAVILHPWVEWESLPPTARPILHH